jgi:hypothetical protein
VNTVSTIGTFRRVRYLGVVMALAAVAAAGCRPPGPGSNTPGGGAALTGEWIVTAFVDGTTQTMVTSIPRRLTVSFNGVQIVWEPCDPWTAPYTADGHRLTVGPVRPPGPRPYDIGCPGDGDLLDEGLAATLPAATWWVRAGDTLMLLGGAGHRALLIATAPLPEPPGPHEGPPGP